jgi:hypothetical protein
VVTDAHGCRALVTAAKCCGCPVDAGSDVPSDASADGSVGDSSATMCTATTDCRLFSSYCGGQCVCEVLGKNDPDPKCDGGTVACLVDPCTGHAAVCDGTQHCALQ